MKSYDDYNEWIYYNTFTNTKVLQIFNGKQFKINVFTSEL